VCLTHITSDDTTTDVAHAGNRLSGIEVDNIREIE
jgi:hypothetical protein